MYINILTIELQNIIDENENMLHDLNADLKERITPNEHVKLVREVETLTKQVRI